MQDDVSELLRSAIREYRQTKVSVWPVSTLSHHRTSPQQPPVQSHRLSCTIVDFLMTLRLSESDQGTRSVVKCTYLHQDLLTAHQGPVFCPFICFHQPSSMQRCGLSVPCPYLHCGERAHMRADFKNSAGHISLHIPTRKFAELVEMVISGNQPESFFFSTEPVRGDGGRKISH